MDEHEIPCRVLTKVQTSEIGESLLTSIGRKKEEPPVFSFGLN